MGQRFSRELPYGATASTTALTRNSSVQSSSTRAFSSIGPTDFSASRHHIHRISEIVDPGDVSSGRPSIVEASASTPAGKTEAPKRLVQSPSGNFLSREEYLRHPERPLTMWERRERVLNATRVGVERYEMESRTAMRQEEAQDQQRERGSFCVCWCLPRWKWG